MEFAYIRQWNKRAIMIIEIGKIGSLVGVIMKEFAYNLVRILHKQRAHLFTNLTPTSTICEYKLCLFSSLIYATEL